MLQAVRTPVPATTLRSARLRLRWARQVSIVVAVILAVGPVLIYLYYQWSDVYVHRPGNEPTTSLLTGLALVLAVGLSVGLSLRAVAWRGYAVDFIRSAVVGCVGASAAILIAMLLAI